MELKRNDQVGEIATIARAIPPGATPILPVDGVIQLPPGTRLDAIKLSGNDLLVTLPDGQVLVIVDGALRIPQIKIGPINIPAPTVAALRSCRETTRVTTRRRDCAIVRVPWAMACTGAN